MTEKKDPPYFMYFPGNYRWSAAFINMLSSGPYGGSEIGELHKIGSRLKGKAPDDDEAWFDACAAVADGVVVGSMLVNRINELSGQPTGTITADIGARIAEMRDAMDHAIKTH